MTGFFYTEIALADLEKEIKILTQRISLKVVTYSICVWSLHLCIIKLFMTSLKCQMASYTDRCSKETEVEESKHLYLSYTALYPQHTSVSGG